MQVTVRWRKQRISFHCWPSIEYSCETLFGRSQVRGKTLKQWLLIVKSGETSIVSSLQKVSRKDGLKSYLAMAWELQVGSQVMTIIDTRGARECPVLARQCTKNKKILQIHPSIRRNYFCRKRSELEFFFTY